MLRKLLREDTNEVMQFAEKLVEGSCDPIQLVETLSHSKYQTLSPKDKLTEFESVGEQLLKTNVKIIKKLAEEQQKSACTSPGGSPKLSKEETRKVIKLVNATVKIQALWRGYKIRKTTPLKLSNANKYFEKGTCLLLHLNFLLQPKGLCLETLYKICPSSDSGVSIERFKDCVQRLKVPLTLAQLQKICEEVDEDSTGFIRYNDYMQCLESLGIYTKMYADKPVTYCHESMAKLVGVLVRKSLAPSDLFQLAANNKKVKEVAATELYKTIDGLGAGLYRREIRAIILHLDPSSTGTINRDDFLLVCKSAEAIWNYQKSSRSPKATPKKSPKKTLKGEDAILGIVEKMGATGSISTAEFVELVEDDTSLTLTKLVNKLKTYYPALGNDEVLCLAKQIPTINGFVTGKALLQYFEKYAKHETQDKKVPLNTYFQLFVSHLKNSLNMNSSTFLKKYGIREAGTLTFYDFKRIIKEVLENIEEGVIVNMWESLAPNERGECNAGDLLGVLESYEAPFENASPIIEGKHIDPTEANRAFRTLDDMLLENKVSIQNLFGKAQSLQLDELSKRLSKIMPAEDLDKLLLVLKEKYDNNILQAQLVNEIKKARVTAEKETSATAPVYGNLIYADLIKTPTKDEEIPAITRFIKKISAESFVEFMLNIDLAPNGNVSAQELQSSLIVKYGDVLTTPEITSLSSALTAKEDEFVPIRKLLRFYDEHFYSPELDSKVLRLDLLNVKSRFLESKKASVSEYFRDLGICESQRISQKVFGDFLKQQYGTTNRGIRRLCQYFSGSGSISLISVQSVIKKIDAFDVGNSSFMASENESKALQEVEGECGKKVQEFMDGLEFDASGLIELKHIEEVIKSECPQLDEKAIKAALIPLSMGKKKKVSKDDIQDYLINFSTTKEPSIKLEVKLLKHRAKAQELDIETFLEKVGLNTEANLAKADFIKTLVSLLHINPKAAEIISSEIEKDMTVNVQDFVDYLAPRPSTPKFSSVHIANCEQSTTPKSIVAELETSNSASLFNVLDLLNFNDEGYTAATSFMSALGKIYPNANPKQKMTLSKQLDTEKKGLIKLTNIINFIEKESVLYTLPNIKEVCNDIIKAVEGLKENEVITVKEFVDKCKSAVKVKRKVLYYVYAKLAGRSSDMLYVRDLLGELTECAAGGVFGSLAVESNKSPSFGNVINLTKCPVVVSRKQPEIPIKSNTVLEIICNVLYPKNKAKMTMTEEVMFRQMDTNQDGFIRKIEVQKWLERRKLSIKNEKELDEFFVLADQNKDNAIDLQEFLNIIKAVKGGSSVKVPISGIVQADPEVILRSGIEKLKKYLEKASSLEDQFMGYDKLNNGALEVRKFKEALKGLGIALTSEEIEQIAKSADLNSDGKIDYEEYAQYLESLDLRSLSKSIKEREMQILKAKIQKGPDYISPRKITEKTKELVKTLKERTNFEKYPIEKLVHLMDFPYDNFTVDLPKQFGILDETTHKYKITLVRSLKAAILCAELLYRSLKEDEEFSDPEYVQVDSIAPGPTTPMLEAKGKQCIFDKLSASALNALDVQVTVTKEVWRSIKSGIFPAIFHYYAKKGLYVFRFFKEFEWVYTIVDGKGIIPASENTLLVPLIVKAYTKLYGNVIDKAFEDQMMDFTGIEPSKIAVSTDVEEAESLWEYLKKAKSALTGCSLDTEGKKVYPILDAFEVKKETGKGRSRLIKLFGSNVGLDQLKVKEAGPTAFLMPYKSWRNTFKIIYTCHEYYKNLSYQLRIWEYNLTTSVDKSAEKYVMLDLSELETDLLVTFAQEDPVAYESLQELTFSIYKVDGVLVAETPMYFYEASKKRQISEYLRMPGPGKFVIIPTVKDQQRDGRFWISLCFSTESGSKSTAIFSDPAAKKIEKKRNQVDAYDLVEPAVQEFVLRRRQTFLSNKGTSG